MKITCPNCKRPFDLSDDQLRQQKGDESTIKYADQKDIAKVRQFHAENFSERQKRHVTETDFVGGFLAAKRNNPEMTAEKFLRPIPQKPMSQTSGSIGVAAGRWLNAPPPAARFLFDKGRRADVR